MAECVNLWGWRGLERTQNARWDEKWQGSGSGSSLSLVPS